MKILLPFTESGYTAGVIHRLGSLGVEGNINGRSPKAEGKPLRSGVHSKRAAPVFVPMCTHDYQGARDSSLTLTLSAGIHMMRERTSKRANGTYVQ